MNVFFIMIFSLQNNFHNFIMTILTKNLILAERMVVYAKVICHFGVFYFQIGDANK